MYLAYILDISYIKQHNYWTKQYKSGIDVLKDLFRKIVNLGISRIIKVYIRNNSIDVLYKIYK